MDQRPRFTLSRPSRVAITVACFATALVLLLRFDLAAQRAYDELPGLRPADNLLLPPVPVLKGLGLGQDTLIATAIWIKALAYFGEHFQKDHRYRWLLTYVTTLKALDPRFRRVFEWGGVVVMYGGRIDNTSVRTSNTILEEGLALFPDDWQLAFMLGCNYVFELKSSDKEIKRRYIEIGLEYLRRASYNKNAPAHITHLVSSLYKKMGWLEAAASYLEEVYLHTEDAKLREELGRQLAQYRDQAQVAQLEDEVAQFDARHRQSYPYLPSGLFRLVGPRPDGRVLSWKSLLEAESPAGDEQQMVDVLLQQRFSSEGLQR